jgi:cyclopropane-fatty-acyl-phospholipid synthase
MMRHIAEATGDRDNLVGYTLSKAQHAYIRERFGLNVELKNFITCDYPPNHYDKIYSIGAWEHVRLGDLDMLLNKLHRTLKPGGRIVHHFFTNPTDDVLTSMLAAQIFFPGSMQPGYPTQVRAFEKAGFRILHRSVHDYRPTLRAWFDNLAANRERAIALVGVPTFNKYMVFFPAAWKFFHSGEAMLIRYVLEKNDEPEA